MILLETSITNRTPQFGGAGYGNHKTLLKNILMKISITKSCSCNCRKTPRCRYKYDIENYIKLRFVNIIHKYRETTYNGKKLRGWIGVCLKK